MKNQLKKLSFLVLICCLSPLSQAEEKEQELVNKVRANQQWQLQKDQCPADISPQQVSRDNATNIDAGLPETVASHYLQCARHDNASACYNLATGLEKLNYWLDAQTVYQQACRLGYASGCTNRAAGMLQEQIKQPQRNAQKMQCIARSFAKSCNWRDPWGCSMYSQLLASGQGVKQDRKKALVVLKDSCRYGEVDPACQTAHEIREYLRKQEAPQK